MPSVSNDLIALLNLLLPGFLAAWVFFGLTAHPKPTPFERVIQALVFNLIIQPFVFLTRFFFAWVGEWFTVGYWSIHSETIASVVFAFLVGLVISGMANNDSAHRWFRGRNWRLGKRKELDQWIWTLKTSFPSEWYSALSRQRSQYLVLHLQGGKRLYGWVDEWPNQPDTGHFVVSEAEWLLDDGKAQPLDGVEHILIPGTKVEMIEFMKQLTSDSPVED